MDKTPQIAKEQIVMTIDTESSRNKASKIQKLAFRCFLLTSANAKKFQDGDRSIRIYTTISRARVNKKLMIIIIIAEHYIIIKSHGHWRKRDYRVLYK